MKVRKGFWSKIAVVLCVVLLVPSFMTLFSYISDMTKVSAATDTSKGELPGQDGTATEVLLPNTKLPTMEVGILSTPAYLRLMEDSEIMIGDQYRFVSSDESVCIIEKQPGYYSAEQWSVKGLKQGGATIQIFKTENGKETEYATYQVNVMPIAPLKEKAVFYLNRYVDILDFFIDGYRSYKSYGVGNYVMESDNGKIVGEEAVELGHTTVTISKVQEGIKMVVGTVECEIVDSEESSACTIREWCPDSRSSDWNLQHLAVEKGGNTLYREFIPKEGIGKTYMVYEKRKDLIFPVGEAKAEVNWGFQDPSFAEKDIWETTFINNTIEIGLYDIQAISRYLTGSYTPDYYSYKIKDKSVFSIKNHKIYPQKKGETTLTITMKKDGKTKKLGTATVKIVDKKAQLFTTSYILSKVNGKFDYTDISLRNCINYYNQKAVYTCKSTDTSVFLCEKNSLAIKIKGGGIASGDIYEKYKGKTRFLGEIKVEVQEDLCIIVIEGMGLNTKSIEMGLYDTSHIGQYLLGGFDETYQYSVKDKKILKVKDDVIYPQKKGKTTLTVKVKKNGKSKTLGTITVKITDKDAILNRDEIKIGYIKNEEYPIKHYIKFYHPKATYTCKISDTSVVTYNKKTQKLKLKGTGKTTITIYEKYKGRTRKVGKMKIEIRK